MRNLQLGIVAAALTAAVATHQSTIQSPITNQHSTIEQHDMALVGYDVSAEHNAFGGTPGLRATGTGTNGRDMQA